MKLTREEEIEIGKAFLEKFENLVDFELGNLKSRRNILFNCMVFAISEEIINTPNKQAILKSIFDQINKLIGE